MSCFKERITLENPVDAGMARHGLIKETEVLFGALPMKGMDLMVSPQFEKLIGAHGDQPLRIVK
jgi:hypothetical protein